MKLIARQVADGVPVYDLLWDGADVGTLTAFPGEGPMATVRGYGGKETVAAATLHACLTAAQEAFDGLQARQWGEEHIHDEDGSIARMKWDEDQAERFAEHDPSDY